MKFKTTLITKRALRSGAYLIAIIFATFYVYEQGALPWKIAFSHIDIFFRISLCTGIGLIVQAFSFNAVTSYTTNTIRKKRLVNIWATSAIFSVISPIFNGLATRTLLLFKEGIEIREIATGSIRQMFLGLELSFLLGYFGLTYSDIPNTSGFAWLSLSAWVTMLTIRLKGGALKYSRFPTFLNEVLTALTQKIGWYNYSWFVLQILVMSAVYFIAFNELGSTISIPDAIALSSITVLASLIVLVPNGLGITDTIWIYLAIQNGGSAESSLAIAITLRLAHLFSSACIYIFSISITRHQKISK